MKEKRIKVLLDTLANEENINTWMYESKKVEIAQKLAKLDKANAEIVKTIIQSSSILIKESVDFSNTDYLLAQIAEIINE